MAASDHLECKPAGGRALVFQDYLCPVGAAVSKKSQTRTPQKEACKKGTPKIAVCSLKVNSYSEVHLVFTDLSYGNCDPSQSGRARR